MTGSSCEEGRRRRLRPATLATEKLLGYGLSSPPWPQPSNGAFGSLVREEAAVEVEGCRRNARLACSGCMI